MQLAAMQAEEALDALHGELKTAMDKGPACCGTAKELERAEINCVRSQIRELQGALQQVRSVSRGDGSGDVGSWRFISTALIFAASGIIMLEIACLSAQSMLLACDAI